MTSGRFAGYRILLVDDDPDILESMALAFTAENAQVVTAADGNTAVSMFHAQPPHAVVLDMMLPRRSGFLVLEKIQESENPPTGSDDHCKPGATAHAIRAGTRGHCISREAGSPHATA